jgi:hypothetical protein
LVEDIAEVVALVVEDITEVVGVVVDAVTDVVAGWWRTLQMW